MYINGIERDNEITIDAESQVELFKRVLIGETTTEK